MAVDAVDELPVGLCRDCALDGQVLDRVLLQHFALRVCVSCKQDANLRDGTYELIAKSRAKSEFALPDSFFHGLPHMAKPNPRHEAFAPLKLYLKQIVAAEALRLHGDSNGLASELESRRQRAYSSAAKRTKHLLKRKHVLQALDSDISKKHNKSATTEVKDGADARASEASERSESEQEPPPPKRRAYVPVADRDHKHQFGVEERDAAADAWFKACACGMKVEVLKW
ncbi:hypothetical protein PybrP1_004876 [[Pythium] brassicae (nom. inval.)]|nr:hypothetical protein PybrP1_004876 [[Pythium] brassicae (nom. inval.)]